MEVPPSSNKVVVLGCSSYDVDEVYGVARQGIELLGGIQSFVKPGQNVFLKANILRASRPEAAIVTHPSVLAAIARIVQEAGATATIGDSPGGPLSRGLLRGAYGKTGIEQAAKDSGALLNYDTSTVQVHNPDGKLMKLFDVLRAVADSDVVINMPKLKTHSFVYFTGAVKNLFGTIPGLTKMGYHAKLQSATQFSQMLLDLSSVIRPALTVMDAVVGMEGNGPSGGNPKRIGAIIIGVDTTAVDLVATTLAGISHDMVPTIVEARARRLLGADMGALQIVGDPLEALRVNDFKLPATSPQGRGWIPGFIRERVARHIVLNPVPGPDLCTGCGICAQNCPMKAIKIGGRLAAIDYDHCIRCYCCHELCPENAIDLRHSSLANLASKLRLT